MAIGAAVFVAGKPQVAVGISQGTAPVNEVQTVTITASGGTYTLSYGGDTTSALAYNASQTTVRNALLALPSLSGASVSVSETYNSESHRYTITITFAAMNASTVTGNGSSLTGYSHTLTVSQGTQGSAGSNEVDTIAFVAVGGTFRITYAGQTTAAIAYDATATEVQDALIALSNIGPSDVAVTGGDGTFTITFQGSLATSNVSDI